MMTTNLFVIGNVKQLRTGGSFRILLPFFRTSWGVGVLNSAIFNSFHSRVEFGTILEGLRNFGGVFKPPNPPPRYATGSPRVVDEVSVFPGCDVLGHLVSDFPRQAVVSSSSLRTSAFRNVGDQIPTDVEELIRHPFKSGKRKLM